jgi:ubiquinone/menaquinone biosynthesis C-methylase UbiE
VVGVDPGAQQIARARAKAARRRAPIEFQAGMIERLDCPDRTFAVVLATLMMHHLPAGLKRQSLAELARVLKPGGRLVIADFPRQRDRQGRAARLHACGSDLDVLAALVRDAGFAQVTSEDTRPRRFTAFPGADFVTALKR